MRYSDESYTLHFELDEGTIRLSPAQLQEMDGDLETLRKLVADAPRAHLKVELTQQSEGVRVGMSLHLPSRNLFTGDTAPGVLPAWQRCLRKMVRRVEGLKDRLDQRPQIRREVEGTAHTITPIMEPDAATLEVALREGDYVKFREALGVYEEPLEKRIGRLVQRVPQAEQRLGHDFVISEIAEEVYLNAFEQFDDRPPIPLGKWLESLIEPSIIALLENPDEVKENLSFIASAKNLETPQ